jgi:hypothetical protein
MTFRRLLGLACVLAGQLACLVCLSACGSNSASPHGSEPDAAASDAAAVDASIDAPVDAPKDAVIEDVAPVDTGLPDGGGTFNVFDHIPQFGIYVGHDPANYTPPAGILMWQYGTVFVTKLDAQQQSLIGSDLAARVTYYAQCDNYDRIGGVFFVVEPKGQMPQPTDPRIELVRYITPFSDYTEGALATHVYPNADLSAFANVLADGTHDVWIGIGGGSNPYSGDPCSGLTFDAGDDYPEVGFLYSLDFISTKVLLSGQTSALAAFTLGTDAAAPAAISNVQLTATPIAGTFDNTGAAQTGHVTVIVSGHGSSAGGDEYENTQDTVTLGTTQIGAFSTMIDCAPYAAASPDGNPGIFQDNTTDNPRNWCPGALVPSHTFPVTLPAGSTSVVLGITPAQVPSGSYFATSITFTSP